jgi:di/tricarboxylate transporter
VGATREVGEGGGVGVDGNRGETHTPLNTPTHPIRDNAQVRPLKPTDDPLSGTQLYVIAVSVGSVVAWCLNSFLSQFTGEMGVLAILPLVAFFGFGVLRWVLFLGGGVVGSLRATPTRPHSALSHTLLLSAMTLTPPPPPQHPQCSKDDFNGFLWNVVMLAMGGLALGEAVQSSGLLLSISEVRRGVGAG